MESTSGVGDRRVRATGEETRVGPTAGIENGMEETGIELPPIPHISIPRTVLEFDAHAFSHTKWGCIFICDFGLCILDVDHVTYACYLACLTLMN